MCTSLYVSVVTIYRKYTGVRENGFTATATDRFGLPSDRKRRWCGDCAKGHHGALNLAPDKPRRKCEDCAKREPNFGLAVEGRKRWCAHCMQGHAGAVSVGGGTCEACKKKRACCGVPSEGSARWCVPPAVKSSMHHPVYFLSDSLPIVFGVRENDFAAGG